LPFLPAFPVVWRKIRSAFFARAGMIVVFVDALLPCSLQEELSNISLEEKMDLIDRIKDIAAKIAQQKEYIETEEATKNAFIMPLISALGYDVFNPVEVIPEFTADIGTKKGEKVDYAIKRDGKIIIESIPLMLELC
jgi:hypothetical protein